MRFNHLHIPVRDLAGAVDWLAKVWGSQPSFENGGMALVSVHGASLILDAADEDGLATIGFASDHCDEDYRLALEGGAETLEAPRIAHGASERRISAVPAGSHLRSSKS